MEAPTIYFHHTSEDNLNSSHWWDDSQHTQSAGRLPDANDIARIDSPVNGGVCNASVSIISAGATIRGVPQFNGDIRVLRWFDYKGRFELAYFHRISFGEDGRWVGPNRVVLRDSNYISLGQDIDLANRNNWMGDVLPGPNDIAIFQQVSTYYYNPRMSVIYGTCNAGVVASTWTSSTQGYNMSVTYDELVLNCEAAFINPYYMNDCTVNGRFSAATIWFTSMEYYNFFVPEATLRDCTFNGPTYINNSLNNVYVGEQSLTFKNCAFLGETVFFTDNDFATTDQILSQIKARWPISVDNGVTWEGGITFPLVEDVRLGVDRGDGELGLCRIPAPTDVRSGMAVDVDRLGLCHVPTPAQVQLGVLVDVDGVGTLVPSTGNKYMVAAAQVFVPGAVRV